MFFKGLIYCLTLLPLGILAALDDKSKLANRTIDRVSLMILAQSTRRRNVKLLSFQVHPLYR